MRLTYLILFFVTAIMAIGCNQNRNDSEKQKSADISNTDNSKKGKGFTNSNVDSKEDSILKNVRNEENIYKIIFALPEIKERANYIEKETKGARHLRVWICQTPSETDEKCYWVKAGEDNGICFVTHFNFFVSPDNFEVKYFDTLNDTLISLDAWRREIKNSK